MEKETWITKNKVMHAFDEEYGTNLSEFDADDLQFLDILLAVHDEKPFVDSGRVYKTLKKAAGNGVSEMAKNSIYKYAHTPFFNDPEGDIEVFIKTIVDGLKDNKNIANQGSVDIIKNDRYGTLSTKIVTRPLVFAEFSREVPRNRPEIEALLVQNGYVMIVKTTHNICNVLGDPFSNNFNPLFSEYDDDDDDDDDD